MNLKMMQATKLINRNQLQFYMLIMKYHKNPFTVTLKKYLGIYLPKEARDLSSEKHQMPTKATKDKQTNAKLNPAPGLGESTLSK